MIVNSLELDVTRERIEYFQNLLERIRVQADPQDFELMASGYRLEIERMQAEVLDYLLRPLPTNPDRQPV